MKKAADKKARDDAKRKVAEPEGTPLVPASESEIEDTETEA